MDNKYKKVFDYLERELIKNPADYDRIKDIQEFTKIVAEINSTTRFKTCTTAK